MNVALGQFFPGTSALHRLDPRCKLILTIAYIVAVFLARGFVGYGLLILYIGWVVAISGIRPRVMLKALKPVFFIIIFTFVLNVFFAGGGEPLWQWGILKITEHGLRTALAMAMRLALLVFGTQIMTLTTSPIRLTGALESLLKPLARFGFPAHELAMMMTIALRFIPTLVEEADKIMMAQKARGADFESGNIAARAKAMLPLLVPLFVSSFRRADELAMAMEARCYRGGAHRTRLYVSHFTMLDCWAALSMAALIAAVALITV